MRELADEAEDILEYLVLDKVSSSSDDQRKFHLEEASSCSDVENKLHLLEAYSSAYDEMEFQLDKRYLATGDEIQFQLAKLMGEIDLVAREVEKIKASPSSKDLQTKGANSYASSSTTSSSAPPIRKDAVLGFEDYVMDLKDRLCAQQSKLQVVPIFGMGGIGKTTLAKSIYNDPLIMETFTIRVWVTVSQDYSAERILSDLLESLKEFDKGIRGETREKVYKILICRKYLIVMDDIWNLEAWDVVRNVFPHNDKGSGVLLTTRLSDVASYPDPSSKICQMELMGSHQSWILFKKKVFENEECPPELENIGKKIARRCQGLPLAVVVIAGVVSTVSRNLASWQEIAENMKLAGERNQIEEILSLSYLQLPQYLRPCFLYMGSFPEDAEINVTKLIRLWVAEGFLKPPEDLDRFEKAAEECLEELVKRNLVLVRKRKWDGRIKRCGLHDLIRDLCIAKAHESKFFLNLSNRLFLEEETFIESIKNQRRLSIHSINLRHIKSSLSSTIHSIKCWGYMTLNADFVRLLRVLDTEPAIVNKTTLMEQLDVLFHLRYLAVSRNLIDLSDLWNLRNLQTLIILEQEMGVGFCKIYRGLWLGWCMPQLRHVHGSCEIHFYDPKETSYSLESLQTISYLSNRSCTERILKKIPNLKKLKVIYTQNYFEEAACLDLVHLHRLESLEVYGYGVLFGQKLYNFALPKMLKKLILRDLKFDWDNMILVGMLSFLQVFEVIECNFIGDKWKTTKGEFPHLEFLLLRECRYFTDWITESSPFPKLRRLVLHSCSSLNEIPNDIGEISTLELIELRYHAQESLVNSVKEIQKEQEALGNNTLRFIFKDIREVKTFDFLSLRNDDALRVTRKILH